MSPLAQTAAFTRAAQPRSREINVGSRRRAQLRVTSFAHIRPSEVAVEGPGTGLRHYPDPSHGQYEPRAAPHGDERHHDMMSSEACYRLFPLITHASVPLHIEDQEPAGLSVLNRLSDAGPASGRRRRPAPADGTAGASKGQVLPYPATRPTDLRRDLLCKHAPEVLLAQRA
ncbi:haloalkane dehalogenase [Micractinium conductrix]|uniref:Haloalkane dehalogenase n=1 Tax=Micractinium conductrix TaxID=554055 RepID=A0A2P6VSA1_9CHLO|nr:haloalkane dehalogenase [Micractinium conductrix]|eukprot:PSC76962.1 haloalkane dehalogenase [Micractinium conductrix]